jgi:hypothetical protein
MFLYYGQAERSGDRVSSARGDELAAEGRAFP